METLLGDKEMIIPLANFIDATHRFKPPPEIPTQQIPPYNIHVYASYCDCADNDAKVI
jgi:hypothetical protein